MPIILVDDRKGSAELCPIIKRIGVPCQLTRLEYGDACFNGNGPGGEIAIGVERKTLHDMLACVEDARYAAHQRPGMMALYSKSFLCLEGLWEAGNEGWSGTLMQGFNHGASWGPLKTTGNRPVLYSKLYRYMVSVALSGVIITQSNNLTHTAYNITEIYQYFQKPWAKHTSLVERQKLAIPVLTTRPTLVRLWAEDLDDVGLVHGQEAEQYFKSGHHLANADEVDWVKLGVGPKLARRVVRQIRGWK